MKCYELKLCDRFSLYTLCIYIASFFETNNNKTTIICYRSDEKPELDQLYCMRYTNKEGKTVYFRLVDRIRPKWINLAIALKFPPYRIDTLKCESDTVYTLLREWLRGANKDEDPKSVVTWSTLITALQYAGLEEEAEIIEKQFFVTMGDQELVSQKGLICRTLLNDV